MAPTTLFATFNINADSAKAHDEGWAWMDDFFRAPRSAMTHFTIFGTPKECAEVLKGYIEAGTCMIVARLASEDIETQMRMLLEELQPLL